MLTMLQTLSDRLVGTFIPPTFRLPLYAGDFPELRALYGRSCGVRYDSVYSFTHRYDPIFLPPMIKRMHDRKSCTPRIGQAAKKQGINGSECIDSENCSVPS